MALHEELDAINLTTLPHGGTVKVETESGSIYWLTATNVVEEWIYRGTKTVEGIMVLRLPKKGGDGMTQEDTPMGGPHFYTLHADLKVGGSLKAEMSFTTSPVTYIGLVKSMRFEQ